MAWVKKGWVASCDCPTDSCKFPTDEIWMLKISIMPSKFSEIGVSSAPNLVFLYEHCPTRIVFRQVKI